MERKLANPAPLGLAGFAFTTWMLSMVNAGWYSGAGIGVILALAMAYGGGAQLVAGVLEFPRGNTFGTTAFFSYGAFWWSFAIAEAFFPHLLTGQLMAWYLLVWGVFTLYMWFGTFRSNTALFLVFLALWVTFGLLAFGAFGASGLTKIGGYVGLLTAIFAFYASAAQVINESLGRVVLPMGDMARASMAAASAGAGQ